MKKIISICLVLIMTLAFAVSASAYSKQDLIDEFHGHMPEEYRVLLEGQVLNIVRQLDITDEQAVALKAIMDEVVATLPDRGHSIHWYLAEEMEYCVEKFNEACDILGLTYTMYTKTGFHEGDYVYVVYDSNGKKLGELDGDVIKKTDSSETSVILPVCAGVLVLLASAGAIVCKKRFED